MYNFGLDQGKIGSQKKYTDDLRNKCSGINPNIDLEGYEKGFMQGWMQFCVPTKAFDMGRSGDRYFSFCPSEREDLFREKYLAGKHYNELKDVEDDILVKLEEARSTVNESPTNLDNYNQLQKELEKVRRDMRALEVEGIKSNTKFSRP